MTRAVSFNGTLSHHQTIFDWSDIVRPTKSAREALSALDIVTRRLREARHPHAPFPDIYSIITRRVAESVEDGRRVFLEPEWISRLSGKFCDRYLDTLMWALRGEEQDCAAWKESYRHESRGRNIPAEHVVQGLSAHINYDLALGIAENIREFGFSQDARMLARYKRDHDTVNHLLQASIDESFNHLIHDHGCDLSETVRLRMYTLAKRVIMEVLKRWRKRVWTDAMALLAASDERSRAAIVRRMDRRAGWLGRRLSLAASVWAKRPALVSAALRSRLSSPEARGVVLYM